MALFTPEELEELRRADAELDEEFVQTQEEIEESRKRDKQARFDRLDDKGKKIAENKRAYYEANREKIAENQRAYYEANRETDESLGITKEDYNLYKSGNHADPELFTREVMETLTALCERKPLNREFVQKYFAEFPLGFFEIYAFTCFLLMFCYWIFWGRKGRGEIAALIYEVFIVGLVYAYLFYMGRYLIRRTETALWLGASLMIIWMLKREQVFFSMRTAAAFCSCFLLPTAGCFFC